MEKRFRIAILTKTGERVSENFATKDAVDDFMLSLMEKYGKDYIKRFRIMDREKNEVIETEQYRRKENDKSKL